MKGLHRHRVDPLKEEHLTLIYKWQHTKEWEALLGVPKGFTREALTEWYRGIKDNPHYKFYRIGYKGKPVGLISFFDITPKHSRCYWAPFICDQKKSEVMNQMMVINALDKIFFKLHIHKVCAEILETNEPMVKFHEALGFQFEALYVDHIQDHGEYKNVVHMSLFKDQWGKVRNKILIDEA
ncbi:GNAT family N-acetyltransferase [Halobacillus sp. Marseille-Q1614]|uniref:GNAT family N-acetyltransferase n=1 Tax=Halobacillus sp. Marseille-Q1614 TaxID=2709134 RepID=UPI00156DC0D2|nr:GNAT family N-acetyltransferase [Halobacillus sp. Marseille-Q1614]